MCDLDTHLIIEYRGNSRSSILGGGWKWKSQWSLPDMDNVGWA